MINKSKLFPEERYRRILTALEESGRISVEELSKQFGISQVTIRNDLQYLAAQNLLVRTHGGAIQASGDDDEPNFNSRIEMNSPEKNRIGQVAAEMVKDGDVIGLDASTTALAIAAHLVNKSDLTIVTNGLALANQLLPLPGITVYLVGGFLRRDALSLIGLPERDYLPQLNIQRYFFSANGLTLQDGFTEINAQEGAMKELFIRHCRAAVAVIDSSKIGHASFHPFVSLQRIQTIVTNTGASRDYLEKIKAVGVEVRLA